MLIITYEHGRKSSRSRNPITPALPVAKHCRVSSQTPFDPKDGGSVDDGSGGLALGGGASSQKLDQTSALMRVQLVDFVLSILASKRRASVQLTTLMWWVKLISQNCKTSAHAFCNENCRDGEPNLPLLKTNFSPSLVVSGSAIIHHGHTIYCR